MSRIRVNTDILIQQQQQIEQLAGELGNISEEISYINRNLSWQIASREQIKSKLGEYSRYTGNLQRKTQSLSGVLGSIGNNYQNTCKKIAGWTVDGGEIKKDHKGENKKSNEIGDIEKENGWLKKKIEKMILDIIGKGGAVGEIASFPIALAKMLIDDDGITSKDYGAGIKGIGNTIIGAIKAGKAKNLKALIGLSEYEKISLKSPKAGWLGKLENAKVTGWESFKYQLSPFTTGGNEVTEVINGIEVPKNESTVLNGTKVAGWALSLVANGFSNYEEYNKKLGTNEEISKSRAVAETISETGIDILKGAAITAGVAAGCAALGVAAPAVVVGGIGVAVSVVADIACEKLTGSGVTEIISDTLLDVGTVVGKSITGAAANAKKAVSGWFDKVTKSRNYTYAGAW